MASKASSIGSLHLVGDERVELVVRREADPVVVGSQKLLLRRFAAAKRHDRLADR